MPRGKKRIDKRDYGLDGRPNTAARDCTVRTLHVASGLDYDLCAIALAVCGRRKNSGCRLSDWVKVYKTLGLCGNDKVIPHVSSTLDPRLRDNCIVLMRGHVYAIRNGVHSDGPYGFLNNRARVKLAWRIDPALRAEDSKE